MNKPLAEAAVKAVFDPGYEQARGYCSRFVRQVVESVYGERHRELFGASACESGERFLDAGLAFRRRNHQPPLAGDILFKTHAGPFGHVGIYDGTGRVAENSSTSIGRVDGAKGFRSLTAYGIFDVVGRLAAPPVQQDETPTGIYTLYFNGRKVTPLATRQGTAWCPLRPWADALGLAVDWDEEKCVALLDGRELPRDLVVRREGRAWAPVRHLAGLCGLQLQVDARHQRVEVTS